MSYVGGFGSGAADVAMRFVLFASGLLFAAPGDETLGVTHWQLSLAAFILDVPPLAYAWLKHPERAGRDEQASEQASQP